MPRPANDGLGFVVSTARRRGEMVVYGIVTDSLQRMSVAVPYKFATSDQATEIITHALAGFRRPPKPVGG